MRCRVLSRRRGDSGDAAPTLGTRDARRGLNWPAHGAPKTSGFGTQARRAAGRGTPVLPAGQVRPASGSCPGTTAPVVATRIHCEHAGTILRSTFTARTVACCRLHTCRRRIRRSSTLYFRSTPRLRRAWTRRSWRRLRRRSRSRTPLRHRSRARTALPTRSRAPLGSSCSSIRGPCRSRSSKPE